MASSFILLLLTIVATLSEGKNDDWALPVAPRQFPFIAIIRYHNGVVAIGALISRSLVLGSAVHTSGKPGSIAIQLGCISVHNCSTPLISSFERSWRRHKVLMLFRLNILAKYSHTIQTIPIGTAMDYMTPMCTYVGLNGHSGQVYSMSVKISNRASCLKRVPVPRSHRCFENLDSSVILPDKTLGGSIICGTRLVRMMSMYSVLHKTGPHRMFDLTEV
ncbi:uncharacterized protein [Fopius arisanus]|uniref:Uncharacterized protein isoform X2 n=1 Tax=Fopius arisanus TaxID=64838 RepID=A0A9R1TEB2_9HYME|nr:PREDICTED: uncharacterized protein LOC105269333 isoform X2 [Fopius arisanus]